VSYERDELRIDLRDVAEGTPTERLPVPVPERVARYHPLVTEFREQRDRHEISRAQMPRVSLILQGLVLEAERRGYTVSAPDARKVVEHGRATWSGDRDGHLQLTIGGVSVRLRVREDGIRTRAIYPKHSYYNDREYVSARHSTAYEEGAKGRVSISILSPHTRSHRPSSWRDGKRQRLEERLPAILMEIETRAAEERERITLERDAAERRRLAWEDAKARARQLHAEHQRATVLGEQVAAWQRANSIRSYCEAIEQHFPFGESADWVAWARVLADSLDPLSAEPTMPETPADVSADDLRPFLDGWSPFAPERDRRYSF